MAATSRKPLLMALILASTLSLGFGILLYVNEDLRTSTFVLLEEVINEEGEEEVRVKIERPEPNEKQIREITRNKERKKEESLKEKAKDIKKSLVKIEEATGNLKQELGGGSDWQNLYRLMQEIERFTNSTGNKLSSTDSLASYPSLLEDFSKIQVLARRNLAVISGYVAEDPDGMAVFGLLGNSYEMAGRREDLYRSLDLQVRELNKRDGKWQLASERGWVGDMSSVFSEYMRELERVIYGMVPLQEETLADFLDGEMGMESELSLLDQLPTDQELEAMTVAELYESIQEMTTLGDELFAENRATELAATEQMSLETAREQVYAPQTQTGPDLQEALQQGNPENLEQFEAYSEALNQAERAAANMARSAANRQAQAAPGGAQPPGHGQESQTAEQLQQALAQRAGAMARMNAMASNQGREKGNVQDMRGLMMQAYQMTGGGEGGSDSASEGRVLSRAYSSDLNVLGGKGEMVATRSVRLNVNQVLKQAIPGRRLTTHAARKGWIFLDTWYIIGPWQRPRENSFATRFPPEVEVDLDARYTGKEHPRSKEPLPLKWNFVQTDNIRVNPPDEISDSVYYAYTEVFAEQAMEVVVAVASDDIAKMWVNDLVVWEDEGLSAWQIDEGFRRILLKPGYNKVLVRVENGPAVCFFSVLFSPVDALNL